MCLLNFSLYIFYIYFTDCCRVFITCHISHRINILPLKWNVEPLKPFNPFTLPFLCCNFHMYYIWINWKPHQPILNMCFHCHAYFKEFKRRKMAYYIYIYIFHFFYFSLISYFSIFLLASFPFCLKSCL